MSRPSGSVTPHWSERDLGLNRVVAGVGMTFGGGLAAAVLVVAEYVIGIGGLIERLSLGPLVCGLHGWWSAASRSYRVPRQVLDPSDPDHPSLRARADRASATQARRRRRRPA